MEKLRYIKEFENLDKRREELSCQFSELVEKKKDDIIESIIEEFKSFFKKQGFEIKDNNGDKDIKAIYGKTNIILDYSEDINSHKVNKYFLELTLEIQGVSTEEYRDEEYKIKVDIDNEDEFLPIERIILGDIKTKIRKTEKIINILKQRIDKVSSISLDNIHFIIDSKKGRSPSSLKYENVERCFENIF